MNKEVFSAFVTNLRKEAGMTQKQVANKLQVTDRAVSKWERGLSYPDITLMEPLSVVLGISVEELLTCQRRETAIPEPELPALRSVLTITQEEKRIRTQRMRALAWIAIVAALALVVLATMQRNGKLLLEQCTTSPDGNFTFTVYHDSLFGGGLHMKLSHPMNFEGALCPYCGRGIPYQTDQQELNWQLTSVEELSWSEDGRYLLIQGGGSNGISIGLELWDFMKYGKDSPVHSSEITLGILQQMSGYDVYQPLIEGDPLSDLSLKPMLPALPGTGWLPSVTLSDVRWVEGTHQLTMTYAYNGTDGLHRNGELFYDVDTECVISVKDTIAPNK